jgi:hypothetical protein
MITLNKKALHLGAHTWKDIGGLLLGGTFFIILLIVSCVILLIAFIIVVLDYLFSPVLALLSLCRRTPKINLEEPNIPDTENIGNSPFFSQEIAKLEFLPTTKVCWQ